MATTVGIAACSRAGTFQWILTTARRGAQSSSAVASLGLGRHSAGWIPAALSRQRRSGSADCMALWGAACTGDALQ